MTVHLMLYWNSVRVNYWFCSLGTKDTNISSLSKQASSLRNLFEDVKYFPLKLLWVLAFDLTFYKFLPLVRKERLVCWIFKPERPEDMTLYCKPMLKLHLKQWFPLRLVVWTKNKYNIIPTNVSLCFYYIYVFLKYMNLEDVFHFLNNHIFPNEKQHI